MPSPEVTLTIQTENMTVEGEVEMLRDLAPAPEFVFQAARWECDTATFERLMDALLRPNVPIESQRNLFKQKLRSGVWELLYRGAPIRASQYMQIKGRLWPA